MSRGGGAKTRTIKIQGQAFELCVAGREGWKNFGTISLQLASVPAANGCIGTAVHRIIRAVTGLASLPQANLYDQFTPLGSASNSLQNNFSKALQNHWLAKCKTTKRRTSFQDGTLCPRFFFDAKFVCMRFFLCGEMVSQKK